MGLFFLVEYISRDGFKAEQAAGDVKSVQVCVVFR
jgi:hypothetical protein